MAGEVVIGLNSTAAARLGTLMERFGEDREEVMVSRALGLLDAVQNYVDDQGVLTVVDPAAGEGENRFVELVFRKAAGRRPARAA